jgi:HlyD family secretion protein
MVFTCILGIWAWFGQIQEVSHAQGRLVPEGDVYKVQPVVPGEVAELLVEEGEEVEAGEAIARLDRSLLEKDLERLQQTLIADQLHLNQVQGMIDRTMAELQTLGAIASADLRAQESAIRQAQVRADTNESTLAQLYQDVEAHTERLERLRPVVEQGVLAADNLFQIEQAVRDRQQAITQKQGELEEAQGEARRLQAELDQRRAEAQRRQLETQQRLQQLEIQQAELAAKIAETETLLRKAQREMEQTVLYAPVDGIVSTLHIDNVGEVIQAGATIAEVAPADAPLVLQANLPSSEAGLVAPGMTVNLKFDAFPYQDYGILPGTVLSISPDSREVDGIGAIYQVEIALERAYVDHEGQPTPLQAGQTANAEIVIRERRILDILLDPIRQLQEGGINL